MDIVSLSGLSWLSLLLIVVSGLLIGMSKVGVPGVSMVVVPALAFIFGAKQSTGVLLPILIIADFFEVAFYRRHESWNHLVKVLPWALIGLLAALWIGNMVNDKQFKTLIAVLVFFSIGLSQQMIIWFLPKCQF